MKWASVLALVIMSAACASDECVSDDDCEAEEESYEPEGDVSVKVRWSESTQLTIELDGVQRAYFGIVEAGMGETGWYGEDCPDGPYCHELVNQDDSLAGTHYLVSVSTMGQENWDGTLLDGETWMHRDGLEKQVWALFSWDGSCIKTGGEDETLYDYYTAKACPR